MSNSKKKNDGAWFRANNALLAMREDTSAKYATFLAGLKTDAGLLTAVGGMLASFAAAMGYGDEPTGLTPFLAQQTALGNPATVAAQLAQYVDHGIPRTVWLGVLTRPAYYKVYPNSAYPVGYYDDQGQPKVNTATTIRYVPMGAPNYAKSAHDFRRIISSHIARLRKMEDFANKSTNKRINPGGVADADQNT